MKKIILALGSVFFLFVALFINNSVKAKDNINPAAITLPPGYHIEPAVQGLSVPTTAIFDGQDLLVAESGYENTAKSRILRISPKGTVTVLAETGLESPVTGLLMVNGKLYVSHKGKVSIVQSDKSLKDIVTGLPSNGDHQNNNIILGKDGKIYIGQGTVTNSGVVGVDSYTFGWLDKHPEAHDIPCKDITLVGQNFTSDNPLTKGNDKATTGAYHAFGTQSTPGEVIKGEEKCGGSIARFNPDGSGYEMVAWGMRNPFGLELDKNGAVWATFHGADVRGSRPIFNDKDYLVKVEPGAWYGWPDFFNGEKVTDSSFKDPTQPQPEFLWKDHPAVTKPFMSFDTHAAVNGITFSPGGTFGDEGAAFIAEYGAYTTITTGVNLTAGGFKVVKVDMNSKKVTDFASNKLPGPAYLNRQGGFNRPSDVVFGPDDSLYIVDWGAATFTTKGLEYVPQTGLVWRVYSDKQNALFAQGPVQISGAAVPADQRMSDLRNTVELYKSILSTQWPYLVLGTIIVIGLISGIVILFKEKKEKKHKKS